MLRKMGNICVLPEQICFRDLRYVCVLAWKEKTKQLFLSSECVVSGFKNAFLPKNRKNCGGISVAKSVGGGRRGCRWIGRGRRWAGTLRIKNCEKK